MPHSVVFFGTPDFAVPSLEALLKDDAFSVALVVTQPDKPVGRKLIITPPPVKVLAKKNGIPVLQREKITAEDLPDADFFVVVAFGQILKDDVLKKPKIAAVNLHGSLLPKWRGASPIQHMILSGDKEGGVTLQRMVLELDAGPILGQSMIPLNNEETSEHLFESLSILGAELLIETLKKPLNETPQNESEATFCKKLSRSDGEVNPKKQTAEEIDRKVRALVPWPGVRTHIGNLEVKFLKTSLQPSDDAYALPCKDNSTLYILKLQSPGKNPMSGAEWERGNK